MDKPTGSLPIQRTLKYAAGREFFEDTPKTATSRRNIPLTKDIITITDRKKQTYGKKVSRMDGYIFHLPDGTPISRERLQNEIGRIVKRMNEDGIVFKRFTSHCFCPTFATRAEKMKLIAKAF